MPTIQQRGPNSFRVQVRQVGKPPVYRTFKTREEAELFVLSLGKSTKQDPNVSQAVQAYRTLRDEGRRPVRLGSNEDLMLRHLERDLGSDRVSALTPVRMRRWAAMRAQDGAGGYTVGMELSKLGTVLRYASITFGAEFKDVVRECKPLLEHVGLVGPSASRDRRLHLGEEERLLGLAPPWLGDIIRFALATAMRRGEIVRMLWTELDVERRLLKIKDRKDPRRKAGNNQIVPLLNGALEIALRQPRVSDRVFPRSAESISDTFKLVCDAAEVVDLHFHDLRHEATSRLFEQGFSLEQVALVTGHKDWRNLRRYTQLRPEMLHDKHPGTETRPGSPQSGGPDPGTS